MDWEIQASLRHGRTVIPNGLLGVKLKSYKNQFPDGLNLNLKQNDNQEDCYTRWIEYPSRKDALANYIEQAFQARTEKTKWIVNPRDRFKHNRTCP